jgi:6-pyruvoyltetrahydropterin/6-carboxytetrahydropterin synthase
MLLTVSKRLEFSASRRLFDPKLSASENLALYGEESAARYGTGRNYVAHFVFSGPVNRETGMLINISEIKSRVGDVLHDRYDHKFLNEDNAAFADAIPTPENIARQLFRDSEPLFHDSDARLVAVHLCETEQRTATFYADGRCDENHWIDFSAARQTMSPHLSEAENEQLFGIAASPFGHGHHYQLRVTFDRSSAGTATGDVRRQLERLRAELDHKNLNHEVAALRGRPITTESLAHWMFERLESVGPLARVRLHERDDFFAEYWRGERYYLGMQRAFSAAHRLHVRSMREDANFDLFGKCNNPRGHGHLYVTETTIGGDYDARSGTLHSFTAFADAISDALQPWQNKHLDLETEEFRHTPSTGENIVQMLWPKLDSRLGGRVTRLRVAETANNRFTLRR